MSYIFTSLGIIDEHYIYQDIVFIVFNWILSSLEFFLWESWRLFLGDCWLYLWAIGGADTVFSVHGMRHLRSGFHWKVGTFLMATSSCVYQALCLCFRLLDRPLDVSYFHTSLFQYPLYMYVWSLYHMVSTVGVTDTTRNKMETPRVHILVGMLKI